ncbi:MAG TPA: hypothetical protein VNA89_04340 [Gemmatimonadaceae bacterium]|nr:hypothetical protein [Gemmatimonadaceae bacterium]
MRLGAGSPAPPGGGTDPLYDGRPLSPNGYKVELARTLLRRAIMELARP